MATRETYHHGDLPDALLAAGLRLVREAGAHAFSLRQAAREVGVDVAAIYRHYRDKDALLRAVARVGFIELAAAMRASQATATGADPRLRAVGRAYVQFAVAEPELFRLMFGPLGAGGATPLFDEDPSVAFAPLEEGLAALAAEGRCARPPADAATAAWAAVHGLATLFVDGPLPAAEAASRTEVVFDIVLAGLAISPTHGPSA